MKRAFDIVCSVLGLAVLSPLLAAVAFAIWKSDGRPILFLQERVGHRGRNFRIFKFRTMVRDAERLARPLTIGNDPRITRIGHWLRKFKLDELPQLVNVLQGEMTLVGPRPEVPKYVGFYNQDQRRVLELVPGITDPASIAYSNESDLLKTFEDPESAYINVIVPDKIRINLEYAADANVLRDCGVIAGTILRLKSAQHRAAA